MKIAVFGATRGTGYQFVIQALAMGHQVRALAREPSKLALDAESLTVIAGNVLDEPRVRETIAGSDGVLVSLGNTPGNPDMVVSKGTAIVTGVMQELGYPRRLVVVTSLGVGESRDQVPFGFKMLMKTVLGSIMADKEAQEVLVKASGLDWTIVRPGGLTDGPATGQFASGLDPKIVAGQVARADVAAFLLQQFDDTTYLHEAPAIT